MTIEFLVCCDLCKGKGQILVPDNYLCNFCNTEFSKEYSLFHDNGICLSKEPETKYLRHDGPMNEWFSLSYASWLVLPRSIIQEMSIAWQEKLRKLLEELADEFEWDDKCFVGKRDSNGRFIKHDKNLSDYRRGSVEKYRRSK